jgi:hypothetical protein
MRRRNPRARSGAKAPRGGRTPSPGTDRRRLDREARDQSLELGKRTCRGGREVRVGPEERIEVTAGREIIGKEQEHHRVLLDVEGRDRAGHTFAITQRRIDMARILKARLDEIRPRLVGRCGAEFLKVRARLFRRNAFRRGPDLPREDGCQDLMTARPARECDPRDGLPVALFFHGPTGGRYEAGTDVFAAGSRRVLRRRRQADRDASDRAYEQKERACAKQSHCAIVMKRQNGRVSFP